MFVSVVFMRHFFLLLAFSVAGLAAEPVTNYTGELRVVLWRALPRGGGNANNLILDLDAENGRWGRAYGLAQSYNNATHEGIVTKGAVTGDEFALRVDLNIGDDSWVKGGYAGYEVVMRRDAQGQLTGTFTGQFKGLPVTGKVTGEVKPPRPLLENVPPLEISSGLL